MQSIKLRPMVHLKVSGFHISVWVIIGMGLFTGFLAGFLGVGGGFIRMPALMYIIGAPTKVAVGTDLFEVMITGAYGAFSYALKGRVELLAAMIMVVGAAVGAQLGATATLYARGTIIRLYFAITMLAGGVSVVFKHLAEGNKDIYRAALNEWARATSGISDRIELGIWLQNNKAGGEVLVRRATGAPAAGPGGGKDVVVVFRLPDARLGLRPERGDHLLAGARRLARARRSGGNAGPAGGRAGRAAEVQPQACASGRGRAGERRPDDRRPRHADRPARRAHGRADRGGPEAARDLAGLRGSRACAKRRCRKAARSSNAWASPPTVVFATGKPYEEILRRSADSRLLVIGSRPLTSLDPTWHLGDNATRIVRHMTTSTLVVRGREQVRKILLSTDLPASPATVKMAQDVALATGASVEVLYTVPLPTMYMAETPSEATDVVQDAQRLGVQPDQLAQLQAIRRQPARMPALSQATIKLRQGIVEEEIIKESVEGDFDLIVLKEGYLRTPFGLLLGRLSTNLATRSPQASVLIVKR